MAELFFSLRGVPEDEAEQVRQLLEQHQIEFYETSACNWGISMPALWLIHAEQSAVAHELLNDYQQTRQIEQQELYRQLKRENRHKTVWHVFKDQPVRFLVYLAAIGFVIYLHLKLILELGLNLF